MDPGLTGITAAQLPILDPNLGSAALQINVHEVV